VVVVRSRDALTHGDKKAVAPKHQKILGALLAVAAIAPLPVLSVAVRLSNRQHRAAA
jgi:hypothetical protein